MSTTAMSSSTPTTTYPYSYTTFTNTAPSPFETPKIVPSIFPWAGVPCPAPSASSSPKSPFDLPSGSEGSCTISNDEKVNDHAFWDMYECCKSGKMKTMGKGLPCTAVCYADANHSFLDIGECLSKRVQTVVCSPPEAQRGEAPKSESSSATGTASSSKTESAAPSKTETQSASVTTPAATGAANSVFGGQTATSKAGLMLFGLIAVTSAAGMFL